MNALLDALNKFLFPPRVPKSKLLPILLILICEGVVTSAINSYLAFLVFGSFYFLCYNTVDFGVVEDLSKSGNKTGFFAFSFFITQFFSSLAFGWISDKIGIFDC